MRSILILSFIILSSLSFLYGQDVIIKKNGEELKVRVREITSSEIIFNYADSVSGPLYVIAKNDVFMIRYTNGVKEVFATVITNANGRQQGVESGSRINIVNGKYYQNGMPLGYSRLFSIIEGSGNKNAIEEVKRARTSKKMRSFLIWSTPFAAYLTLAFVAGGISSSSNNMSDGSVIMMIGTAGGLITATGVMYILITHRTLKSHLAYAVELYNSGL